MRKGRGSTSTQVSTTRPILHAMIEWAPPATHPSGPRHPTNVGNRLQAPFATAHVKSKPTAQFRVFHPQTQLSPRTIELATATTPSPISIIQYRSLQRIYVAPRYSLAKTKLQRLHF